MIEAKDMASQLIAAEEARTAISPFSDRHSDIDIDTAYAAQWAFVQSKLDAGEQLTGAKLGLTSRAKQEAMNVAEPLYGWITSGMIIEYGEPVDRSSLIHPRAEPEIAFLLGRDVTAPATVTSVLAATEAVFAAVDILDSRYHDFRFTLPDVIADNASGSRIVLGPQARRLDELVDLAPARVCAEDGRCGDVYRRRRRGGGSSRGGGGLAGQSPRLAGQDPEGQARWSCPAASPRLSRSSLVPPSPPSSTAWAR